MNKRIKNSYYEQMDEFIERNRIDTSRIVEWYPYSLLKSIMVLENNKMYMCDLLYKKYHRIDDIHIGDEYEDETYIDENAWRELLACVLRNKFSDAMTVAENVKDLAGVSKTAMTHYCNGRMTPSLYVANKIANCIRRSLSEFYIPEYSRYETLYVRTIKEWQYELKRFESLYFEFSEQVMVWYPINLYEIALRTHNNSRFVYDIRTTKITQVYDGEVGPVIISEQEWRERYGEVLRRYMDTANMSRSYLARLIDINPMGLYNYMYGKSTPSLYIATKIARALNRTLTDFQVM